MRIGEVRKLITDAVLDERERCARIADREANDPHGSNPGCATAEFIASEIRSARPPKIRVVRPETAVKNPEIVTPGTIVAGQALIGDEIVDRFRMAEKNA